MRAFTFQTRMVVILMLLPSGGAMAQDLSEPWVEEAEIGIPQYFAVLVSEAEASAEWYSQVFELEELERSEADDGSWEIINLKNGRLFVEIIRDARAQEVERAVGVRKVGFYVPDVRRVADRVERATGERPRVLDFVRFGVRIIQIRDPDGTLLQLFSPLEESAVAPAVASGLARTRAFDSACAAPEARQFDFWLGDWVIEQRILRQDGSYAEFPARTSVRPAAAGCALIEDWRGTVQFFWTGMEAPAALHGLSVRAWDPATRAWVIHWLDDRDPSLGEPFVGGFEDGRGVFTQTTTGEDGVERTSRIAFDNPAEGVVEWSLATSRDGGESWTTLWSMHMTRQQGRSSHHDDD